MRPGLFATPRDVVRLLTALKSYCDLRRTLVHGRLEIAIAPDGAAFFIVENAMAEPVEAFANRIVLRGLELNSILAGLEKLVDAITGQRLA